MHALVGDILESQRDPLLVLTQRSDAVPQLVAIEKDESAGGNLHRARHHGRAILTRVQLVVEPARRLIEDTEQKRIAASGVVGGIVMPPDVIARSRVEIQRVSVWVVGR